MYALTEAKEAMKDPMADYEAVIEQLDVAHEILGACLYNMEITTMTDISEGYGQHSGATAEEITDDELDSYR